MTVQGQTRPPMLYLVLLSVCLVVLSVAALGGGVALMADVTGGNLQMEESWLDGTLFADYFVPGLFLLVVFGLGSLAVLYALWVRPQFTPLARLTSWTHEHWSWTAVITLGVTLVLWIAIQYVVIEKFHPLQVITALLGVLIMAFALLPDVRHYYETPATA